MQTTTETVPLSPFVSVVAGESVRRLGSWELLGRQGEGPLARLYLARPAGAADARAAAYAVKVLLERFEDDPRAVALFQREAELGRAIVHPHLISVLAAHLAGPPYYLVMPWLPGRTVRRMLDERGAIDVPLA
ncbi:MAG TPA: hypothetical protein VJL29_14315, partial [Thermoguttaceae bacterium]|nr:hypothetical protein [Thermoguttaceae bacterium]